MELERQSPEAFGFVAGVARRYARLIETAGSEGEPTLGGQLFYAGKLDTEGRMLIAAANIAGAATLAATADRAGQKQAVRDGIADFLVNSLDEALRILKNQLRKRETVAVCVALAHEAVEGEMRERGVQPDLARQQIEGMLRAGADATETSVLLTWSVASAPAQWLPKLDAIALECLDAEDRAARRWLRLAPRYLGRMAQGLHVLECNPEFAAAFTEQVRGRVEQGQIGVPVEIRWDNGGVRERHCFAPASLDRQSC